MILRGAPSGLSRSSIPYDEMSRFPECGPAPSKPRREGNTLQQLASVVRSIWPGQTSIALSPLGQMFRWCHCHDFNASVNMEQRWPPN